MFTVLTQQITISHNLNQIMIYFFLCFFMFGIGAFAQDMPVMTPYVQDSLQSVLIEGATKYGASFPVNARVNVPDGFKVSVFYAGSPLQKPRFMAWSPDTVLHIADLSAASIFALPDNNADGIADTIKKIATNVVAHDIAFYRGDLYAAQERSVLRLQDLNKDGFYESRSEFIAPIAEGATQPGGGHTTRTILIDSVRQKIYLSIGSRCNVCRADEPGSQDFQRALVEEWNLDGTGRRTFVTGTRNAVGLLMRGGRVWAANNGSDNQGNNIPPEWIDVLRENGFYGYPFAHSHGIYFPISNASPADYKALLPLTANDSIKVQSMVQPAALIQAHSAPMALISSHPNMPERYRNGIFVALRGSWNRSPATGGKIIYLDFDNQYDTTANFTTDFLTGFMTDSTKSSNWGWARPVGLTFDTKGRLYIGSDAITQCILLVSPQTQTSTEEEKNHGIDAPMMFVESGELIIRWNMPSAMIHQISLMDMRGSLIANYEQQEIPSGLIQLQGLVQGMYFLHIVMNDGSHQASSIMLMK